MNFETYSLIPGAIFVTRHATRITTVLGSCISVALFDPSTGIGGLNHYLYPYSESKTERTARYGDIAMRKLLKDMFDLGAGRGSIVAQIFGGASFLGDDTSSLVAQKNQETARIFLERHEIPVLRTETGGHRGRKIVFNTRENTVRVDLLAGANPHPGLSSESKEKSFV